MISINVKKVEIENIYHLQNIAKQTFFETFSIENTEEDMSVYLNENFSIQKLTEELMDKNSEFYFSIIENTVIGYLKVNFEKSQSEFQDDEALKIERIYVLKEFHGENVGQLLYNQALKIARIKNKKHIWLGVWEDNARAINFYKKNGFVEFGSYIFKLGNDLQTDIKMKLELK